MFREEYKKAFEPILPAEDSLEKIQRRAGKETFRKPFQFHPIPAMLLGMCLIFVLTLPVSAKSSQLIYRILVKYAPRLTEYILTEKVTSSSQGITMQLEAIEVNEKKAEIWVSFSDEPGSDKINGRVDMYDSYGLYSYSGVSNVGGGGFGEYDAAEDKSYHKISVSTFDEFDMEFLQFKVRMLLTEISEEQKEISLDNISRQPATRKVELYSKGEAVGKKAFDSFFGTTGSLLQKYSCSVLDLTKPDSSLWNDLTITGIAYEEGVLRVQFCRGNQDAADRYLELSLIEPDGTARHRDAAVNWQEEVEGKRVMFEEHWFLVEESELEKIRLEGIYHISEGAVYGNWEVSFKVEDYTGEEQTEE